MKARNLQKEVVVIAGKAKSNFKTILLVMVGAVVAYGAIYLFTPKPQMPADLKATIDSLSKANEALQAKQLVIDSTVNVYESQVEIINGMIGSITEKTTIIREFYHEQSTAAGKYTPTQVDSFFKARYKY